MKQFLLTASIPIAFYTPLYAEPYFSGSVKASWGPEGREMTLLEDFSFVDGNEVKWTTPKGAVVDGASIPRPFWALIGGPFSGKYREASVIHDYSCDVKSGYWKDVHRVFYEGMITSGVAEIKAKTMYAAVYYFGSRWKIEHSPSLKCLQEGKSCFGYLDIETMSPEIDEAAFQTLTSFIEGMNPSLEDIENFDSAALAEIRQYDSLNYEKEWYFLPPKNDLDGLTDEQRIEKLMDDVQ